MIGRTLGGATVAIMQGVIITLISFALGFRIHSFWALPIALLFMLLVALMFTALGTAIASRLEDMQAFPLIMNLLIMPIFFLSGSLFPVTNLPRALDIVIRLNPLSYGVDGLRGALTGAYQFGFALDFAVLAGATILFSVIGAWMFSKIEL